MQIKDFLLKLDIKVYIIFLFALLLRFIGITYGLPLILNLDEPSLVSTSLQLNNTNFNPQRFDWPHLHFYLNFFVYGIFFIFRKIIEIFELRPTIEIFFPLMWKSPAIFVLLSRILNSLLGALTVIPIFLFSKKVLKKQNLALAAAFLFSIMPVHVIDSHNALLDTAMTFWISLFLCYVYDLKSKSSIKNFAIAGIFIGLAISTKYTALLYLPFLALLIIINSNLLLSPNIRSSIDSLKQVFRQLLTLNFLIKSVVLSVFLILTYLITNFTIMLNPKLFWSDAYGKGFLFQLENVGNKNSLEYPLSLFENIYTQALTDYGISLYLVFGLLVLSFLFFGYRKKVITKLLLLPIFFYIYISGKDRSPPHYFIFLYPLIATAVVYYLYDLSAYINKKLGYSSKLLFNLFLIFTLLSPIYLSLKYVFKISRGDTRVEFYKWVNSKNDLFPIFYYGEDLDLVSFDKDKNIIYERIKLVDYGYLESDSEFVYLVIGIKDVSKAKLLDPNSDILEIKGGEQDVLVNATLEKSFDGGDKLGPPIYVFKVKNN